MLGMFHMHERLPSTQVGWGVFPQAACSRILFARSWPPKIWPFRVYPPTPRSRGAFVSQRNADWLNAAESVRGPAFFPQEHGRSTRRVAHGRRERVFAATRSSSWKTLAGNCRGNPCGNPCGKLLRGALEAPDPSRKGAGAQSPNPRAKKTPTPKGCKAPTLRRPQAQNRRSQPPRLKGKAQSPKAQNLKAPKAPKSNARRLQKF